MLSEVPDCWKKEPLGGLLDGIDGGVSVNSQSEPASASELGILKTSCVSNGFFNASENKVVSDENEIQRLKEPVQAETIIFSRMNTPKLVGANAYVPMERKNLFLPDRLWALKPIAEINPRWLGLYMSYLFETGAFEALGSGTSGSMKNISKSKLRDVCILVPSLDEQHRIAEILSSVDTSIQTTQAVIEQAERVKRGLMEELLTGGLGSEAIERGEVPEGWEIITLASDGIDLIDGDRGKQYPKSSDFSGDGYCLFLSAKNVTKQGFRFDEKQFVTKEKHQALRKGALERDDIVVTTRGTVGNVAHFNKAVPYDIVRINSGMVIVRNQSERVLTDYLFSYLASSVVDEQIKLRTHGSAQPALTIKTLKTLRLALPSLSRQQDMNSILLSQNAAIEASFMQLHSLQRLKSALMDDLLTGKVRTV